MMGGRGWPGGEPVEPTEEKPRFSAASPPRFVQRSRIRSYANRPYSYCLRRRRHWRPPLSGPGRCRAIAGDLADCADHDRHGQQALRARASRRGRIRSSATAVASLRARRSRNMALRQRQSVRLSTCKAVHSEDRRLARCRFRRLCERADGLGRCIGAHSACAARTKRDPRASHALAGAAGGASLHGLRRSRRSIESRRPDPRHWQSDPRWIWTSWSSGFSRRCRIKAELQRGWTAGK